MKNCFAAVRTRFLSRMACAAIEAVMVASVRYGVRFSRRDSTRTDESAVPLLASVIERFDGKNKNLINSARCDDRSRSLVFELARNETAAALRLKF